MTLVKFNPGPASASFDNLFDDFLQPWGRPLKTNTESFPRTNIFETTEGYHLELNAAGRNKEDFQIQVENGLLTISYEKKEEKEAPEYDTIRREFNLASFKRSFSLDDSIQADDIKAKYENGILRLYLPKKEQSQPASKQINVQ